MNQTLTGTTGDDVLFGDVGDDYLYGGHGNDYLHGGAGGGNDYLCGGDGNDVLYGFDGNNYLHGGAGNDTLYGGHGSDVLNGGRGNDYLEGGYYGSNTYVFARGDGSDILSDYHAEGWIHNTLHFTDINPADIDFVRLAHGMSTWSDWVIGYGGQGDQITLQHAQFGGDYGVQAVHFADGTVWGRSELVARLVTAHVLGTNGDDGLGGSPLNDTIFGGGGNDQLFGHEGHDSLLGGSGGDWLVGSEGNDTLVGGAGNDTLFGDTGSNVYVLSQGDGQDIVYGHPGNETDHNVLHFTDINPADIDFVRLVHGGSSGWSDWVIGYGGQGDQIILKYAEYGSDYGVQAVHFADGTVWDRSELDARILGLTIRGSDADDWLDATHRNDSLHGGKGHDSLWGHDGNDLLDGGSGNDHLVGGAGNDMLIGGTGNDTLVGGAGNDTASYTGATQGVTVDLKITTAQKTGQGSDVLLEVENLIGSAYADRLTGDAGDNLLDGGKGNDTLSGGGGNDTLIGGSGADSLLGGGGTDWLFGGSGADWLDGGSGADTLVGGAGADTLVGGTGQDVFILTNIQDSGVALAQRDLIVDFQRGLDKIDLSAIDARTGVDGHQAFTKLSVGAGFDGTLTGAGVLYYDSVDQVLYGSVKSNGAADFAIGFGGVLPELGLSDFIL